MFQFSQKILVDAKEVLGNKCTEICYRSWQGFDLDVFAADSISFLLNVEAEVL